MKVRYDEDFVSGEDRLYVWSRTGKETRAFILAGVVVPEGDVKPVCMSDTLEMREDGIGEVKQFLQACADAAWEAGIFPRQIADKRDELTATKFHLDDMRKLVFSNRELVCEIS